jgi:hypothetical protein
MQAMMVCGEHDIDMDRIQYELKMDSLDGVGYGTTRQIRPIPEEPRDMRLEALVRQLFNLQDTNADGVLEEVELARLNEKIARLCNGKGTNSTALRMTAAALFRERLDAFGRPVPYATFRKYVLRILGELEADETAQELILEKFVDEASLGRGTPDVGIFRYKAHAGVAQAPYMPVAPRRISFMPVAPCRMGMPISLSRDPRLQQQKMVTL